MNLFFLLQDDKLSKLKTMLMSTTKEQRSRIVNSKIDGNTLLFTSCQQGKLHFVKFLLDDCNADIELKGIQIFDTVFICLLIFDKINVYLFVEFCLTQLVTNYRFILQMCGTIALVSNKNTV